MNSLVKEEDLRFHENLEGRIQYLAMAPSYLNTLIPVFEAIMNSLQGIRGRFGEEWTKSGHIRIEIQSDKNGDPHSFTITDNGIGLDDDNYKSFRTYDSAMTPIAIVSVACAFAMAVSASVAAAEESPEDLLAKDAAVVQVCLDVAEARRVVVEAPEGSNAVSPSETEKEKKTGPEGHLEEAAHIAGYAAESCIGVVSDPCLETEEGASTYGMINCIGREWEVWDARLNASYRERMAPQVGPATNALTDELEAKQLRKIQTAWIPWRDAMCEVLYSEGIPIHGSLGRVDGAHCNMVLTARQALWMEGLFLPAF